MSGFQECDSTSALIQDNASCLNSYINTIKQRSIKKELRDTVIFGSNLLQSQSFCIDIDDLSGENSD